MIVFSRRTAHSPLTSHPRRGVFFLEYLREIAGVVVLLGMISAGLQKMNPQAKQAATVECSAPVYNLGFAGHDQRFWMHGLHEGVTELDLDSISERRNPLSRTIGPCDVARNGEESITTAIADSLGRLMIFRNEQAMVFHDGRVDRKSFPSVDVSMDGNTVVGMMHEGGFLVWKWNGEQFDEQYVEMPGRHETIRLSDDASQLALSTDHSRIVFWDLHENRIVKTVSTYGPRISQLCWSHDGKLLATADDEGAVKLWESVTGEKVWQTSADDLSCLALCFSPDDSQLITGGFDEIIRVWDIRQGTMVREFTGHTGPVRTLAYHPTQPLIVSGSLDGSVRTWVAN